MFTRVRPTTTARSITQTFRRFNSSHSNHTPEPETTFEITITKIFGVAAVLGGYFYYNSNNKSDKPFLNLKLFEQEASGERNHLRNEHMAKRRKMGFIKEFAKDKGGIGQKQYARMARERQPFPTVLIPAASPYGKYGEQFGAGIHLDKLGPRKARPRLYAPIDPYAQ
ncbi:uncharacterized protein J8A68_001291 [[Candida] subhashii]|uniref:Uncharacterized protein n=1 Tax=[Candida] subhashii TaxID=561895 RepID=A0A8J5QS38_9ASCO|nr:uncharacterized protein J8A68_001291 [[Candida] subhashii]KAG7665235.1 hypothetical protein J8A68_001291 [[Candida] subhashii]